MTVKRQDLAFKLPVGWTFPRNHMVLSSPHSGPQVEVKIFVEKFGADITKKLRVLETLQATLGSCFPAYEVRSLLERPVAAGVCVEAKLQPRSGSQLSPARFYAVLLSNHLVLFDFRRPESASHFDLIVRRFVHGVRESGVPAQVTQEFASARRRDTCLIRQNLEQWQVFLCHNSEDKNEVRKLRDRLFDEGIVSWFDEEEVGLGTQFMPNIEQGLSNVDAVIVARGSNGFGDWQELEYGAAMNEFVRRKRSGARKLKIIPVALPGAPALANWAGFLGTFHGVQFSKSLTKTGIKKLVSEILPG